MRPLWIIAIVVCGAFALATVASANLRDEVRSVAAAATDVIVPTGDEASPSPAPSPTEPAPEPSATASPASTPEPDAEADGAGAHPDNHGAAVSAVAKDKGAVGTKTTPSGKTVTNHGQAVSAVAHSDAGKPNGGGNGGNGGGNGKD